MKYMMKRRWFLLGGERPIFDEKGREAFRLNGSAFSVGQKLSFKDGRDTELAFVSQKTQDGAPTYEIYHGNDLQAVVRKTGFSNDRCKLSIEAGAPDDLHAEGNLTEHEYTFTREARPVGRVSKAWFNKGATYGVEVGRGEDELLLLAGAVVIDLCCQIKDCG
jgi:uncharacterized protein YxjI